MNLITKQQYVSSLDRLVWKRVFATGGTNECKIIQLSKN